MSLKDVHPEQQFITKDGIMLANLFDLSLELGDMSDETFMHHVNESKNDFYNWVHNIIEDKRLAKQLSQLTDKDEMIKAIQTRILDLQKDDSHGSFGNEMHFLDHTHLLAGLFILMFVGLVLLRALVF